MYSNYYTYPYQKKNYFYSHNNNHSIIFCISYVILHHLPLIILSRLIISSSFFFFFHFFCFSSPPVNFFWYVAFMSNIIHSINYAGKNIHIFFTYIIIWKFLIGYFKHFDRSLYYTILK